MASRLRFPDVHLTLSIIIYFMLRNSSPAAVHVLVGLLLSAAALGEGVCVNGTVTYEGEEYGACEASEASEARALGPPGSVAVPQAALPFPRR